MLFFLRRSIISAKEKKGIEQAVYEAEKDTSGEIKVIIEKKNISARPLERARSLFAKYKLYETKERNGALFYIELSSKTFYVYGDEGIYEKLGDAYWNELAQNALSTIKKERSWIQGLCEAIRELGISLKAYYPYQKDDINELNDRVEII